jgi:hypothetical protein
METWTESMDVDVYHGHKYAEWTWTCSMNMGITAWTCNMDLDMQHGHGHAVRTWAYTMNMDMHHGHAA